MSDLEEQEEEAVLAHAEDAAAAGPEPEGEDAADAATDEDGAAEDQGTAEDDDAERGEET
jgi:hypothetical protein